MTQEKFIKTREEYEAMSNRDLQDLYYEFTDWCYAKEQADDVVPEYYIVMELLHKRQAEAWAKTL